MSQYEKATDGRTFVPVRVVYTRYEGEYTGQNEFGTRFHGEYIAQNEFVTRFRGEYIAQNEFVTRTNQVSNRKQRNKTSLLLVFNYARKRGKTELV